MKPPTNFVAKPGDGKVTLSWSPVTGATGYNLYRSTASGAEVFMWRVVGTTFTDSGLTDGVAYYYKVTAITESSLSSESQATPVAPVSSPIIVSAGPAQTVNVGDTVNFTGTVSGGTPPLGYLWNFGDGTTLTGILKPSHTYPAAGSFTVSLQATDSTGKSSQGTVLITVNPVIVPPAPPLLHSCNLQYLGLFRVPLYPTPPGSDPSANLSYGGTALAYDPAHNGLFIVGAVNGIQSGSIAELSIPAPVNGSITSMNTATFLQPFAAVVSKLPNDPLIPLSANGNQLPNIGGLIVVGGNIIGTAFVGYDSSGMAMHSHFTVSSTNLASASVSGLYQVGSLGGGLVGGYMTAIPAEWQSKFGCTHLTGQSDLSVISRTSSGPAAFGFNPATLASGVNPVIAYMYYPVSDPLGPYEGQANPIQSGTTSVAGMVFVPGTSTVLFVGSTGSSYNGYGVGNDWGVPSNNKGAMALNNSYAFQVWAYNANDLLASLNEFIKPWQVRPYDVWNFTVPGISGNVTIGGVAFDPATNKVYVSLLNTDQVKPYTNLPLIAVFQIVPDAIAPCPEIGTLTGAPSVPPNFDPAYFDKPQSVGTYAGPVNHGDQVVLTAGNVYDTSGGSISKVAFYLNDALLGQGAPTAIGNWTITITAPATAGTYTVKAIATSGGNLQSAPVSWTLVVI